MPRGIGHCINANKADDSRRPWNWLKLEELMMERFVTGPTRPNRGGYTALVGQININILAPGNR